MVVLAGFDFSNKLAGMLDVRNDRILKLADLRFIAIAAIEEQYVIAALFYQLVNFIRLQVLSAVDDAFLIYFDIKMGTEINKLFFYLDGKAGKIGAGTLGPLEINPLKTRVFLGGAHIFLEVRHIAAESSIDTVLRY